MRRGVAWCSALLLSVAICPAAAQQSAAEAIPRRSSQLDPEAALTLRPERPLRPLAQRAARMLALQLPVEITVGEPPPPEVIEAVPMAHVGLARDGAEVLVLLGGPEGLLYPSRVDLPASRDAAARAVALAVQALRDAAIAGPPPEAAEALSAGDPARTRGERVSYVYYEREGGLFGVRRRHEPLARPTIYLRALLGFSTARQTVLVGPGAGVGLCIELSCLVIEGDLPVIPEQRPSPRDGEVVSYLPISFSMRFQIRPFRLGDFLPGLTFGILSRFGNAWIDATGAAQTVTDFGLRGSLEIAWIFAAPFEWAVELGIDLVANPATFYRDMEPVVLEDVITVWGVTSLRLRP